jgi:hypothetical protein
MTKVKCDICNNETNNYTTAVDWYDCDVIICDDFLCLKIFNQKMGF